MGFTRVLKLPELLEKKSFFLLGPRSTGKTHLILEQLKDKAKIIDLLDGATHLRLLENPSVLNEIVERLPADKIIVIDEIQKNPSLLDQVHLLIEKRQRRFLLTGSSARKLRAGGANLLAGRAWEANLFPLIRTEIPNFDLDLYLRYGGLPQVYGANDPKEELSAYVKTYLQEEIQSEGLVRKIPQFARFLKVAALANGQLINYSAIGSDSAVSASTVREYFSILNDTLIGFIVDPWTESRKRKALQTAKFYFFDTGVTHTLSGTQSLDRNSDLYGRSFEQWIGMELRAYVSYRRLMQPIYFWRSVNGQEVDFLVGDQLAIKVKSSKKITQSDLLGLKALAEEKVHKRFICVSNDPIDRIVDGVECLHWNSFLQELWL